MIVIGTLHTWAEVGLSIPCSYSCPENMYTRGSDTVFKQKTRSRALYFELKLY